VLGRAEDLNGAARALAASAEIAERDGRLPRAVELLRRVRVFNLT
jgi:hypothetical protein